MLPFCTSKNNHLAFANLENSFYLSLISWNYINNYNYNTSFVHSFFGHFSLIRWTDYKWPTIILHQWQFTNQYIISSSDSANPHPHSQIPKRYKEQMTLLYISTNNTNWFWTISIHSTLFTVQRPLKMKRMSKHRQPM